MEGTTITRGRQGRAGLTPQPIRTLWFVNVHYHGYEGAHAMSFEVRVVDDDGDGISGVRVTLSFTSIIRGMTAAEHTDLDGSAYFDGYDDGEVDVFVDGSNYGTYRYEDGECITITK